MLVIFMQEYAKEIKPVFISDDKVTPMELKGAIRKGYREATPAEIALMYVYGNYLQTDLNHGFILELHEKVAVRASIKGLHESYGPHRIKDEVPSYLWPILLNSTNSIQKDAHCLFLARAI